MAKKKEREPLLRLKYNVHLEDLSDSECRQWLEAMFYYKQEGKILENITSGVKAIIRRQIEEREGDKESYDNVCKQRSEAVKKRWNKNKDTSDTVVYDSIQSDTSDTNNNSNNKIIKKENIKKKYLDNVLLSESEYNKLVDKYGKAVIERKIEDLNNYIGSKGKKYKSHYFTILERLRRENIKPLEKPTPETINNDLHTDTRASWLKEAFPLNK